MMDDATADEEGTVTGSRSGTGVPPAFPGLVSVVLPARNAASVIAGQLEGLSRQEYPGAWEVVIADNASTDDTAGVAPGWLHAMADAARGADIVGGHTDYAALNTPRARSWRPSVRKDRLPDVFGFLPYAVGASLGVRTAVFQALGGFNEEYARGGDDVEFCWRAQLASYTLGHAPDAVMLYRLRDRLWPLARQGYGYGRSDAHLYRDFRAAGLPPLRAGAGFRSWGRLIRRLPEL